MSSRMDDDIQDILAAVSVPSVPQRTSDLQAMARAWMNERTSPELLPYPTDLVARITERIKKQVGYKLYYIVCLAGADRS